MMVTGRRVIVWFEKEAALPFAAHHYATQKYVDCHAGYHYVVVCAPLTQCYDARIGHNVTFVRYH